MEIHVHLGRENLRYNLDLKEVTEEFEEELQWLHITSDSIWNTGRERETKHPFTQSELKLIVTGQSRESVTQKRFWRLRPDGLAFRLTTKTKTGTVCILEFKRMSDVTDQYLIRVRSRVEDQYESLTQVPRCDTTSSELESRTDQIHYGIPVPQWARPKEES